MGRRGTKRGGRRKLRFLARITVVLVLVAAYAWYYVITPTALTAKLAPSSSDQTILIVTLQNPTYKFVAGSVTRVDTGVDLPRGNSTTVLQSIPGTYPFFLFPGLSQELNVPMNFRVLPGFDYDIYLQIDGVGQRIITLSIPKS